MHMVTNAGGYLNFGRFKCIDDYSIEVTAYTDKHCASTGSYAWIMTDKECDLIPILRADPTLSQIAYFSANFSHSCINTKKNTENISPELLIILFGLIAILCCISLGCIYGRYHEKQIGESFTAMGDRSTLILKP
eukprot:UN34216